MSIQVAMGLPSTSSGGEEKRKGPSYWSPENHQANEGNTYLRAEEWLKDVGEYTLPVNKATVAVNLEMGQAILRYREELKMYAAIEDQQNPQRTLDAMDDYRFLDKRHEEMKKEWPKGKDRAIWWKSLEELREKMDQEIKKMKHGAFVKFSVRSPKDAALVVKKHYDLIEEYISNSKVHPDSTEALSDDVKALKHAAWMSLKVDCGEEALLLFVRSERIYIDILQHELFCKGEKVESFDLKVHIFEFFTGFDPNYEFRMFISEGQRTALTMYNPWVYDQVVISNKDKILSLILELFEKIKGHIRSSNYSLDFAISTDLTSCWIVELNNFLPPLAGSGLFSYYDERDRTIIEKGPFEFRIRETEVKEEDFVQERVNSETGEKTKIIMQPAKPEIMLWLKNMRRKLAGLPPLASPSTASKHKTPEKADTSSPSSQTDSEGFQCIVM